MKGDIMPFCPNCGYEYREGNTVCPDCNMELVQRKEEEFRDETEGTGTAVFGMVLYAIMFFSGCGAYIIQLVGYIKFWGLAGLFGHMLYF